ncbi:MAG: hypothetical protein WBX00_00675 [Isosphaeraceae bacterium]|jgi:hypothetical protein
MPDKKTKDSGSAPPIDLDLKARPTAGPANHDMNRFHIFLIDTGWSTAVSKLVRSHLPLLYEYQSQDSLYLLTPEQSVEILKRSPEFIGHDPTILVYDLYAPAGREHRNYHGFHLSLGRFKKPEQALSRLQEFVRFLISHRSAVALDTEVRRELNREGARGMIKILREASTELL